MSKSSVEKKLKDAVNNATPDLRKKVMERCNLDSEKGTTIIIKQPRSKRMEVAYGVLALVASILLICNVSINMINANKINRIETVVDIDVNPSIELGINSEDRIVFVRAINEDALEILDGMELKGTQTRVAVNAILGSMFEHGYLQGTTDSILVSVENSDENKSEEIRADITQNIDSLVSAYSCEVNVIGQTITEDDELKNTSLEYGISEGKAALIRKIMDMSTAYTFDDLVYLNITELNEIILGIENYNPDEDADNNQEDIVEEEKETLIDEGISIEVTDEVEDEEEDSVSDNSVSNNSVSSNEAKPSDSISDNEASVSNNTVISSNAATTVVQ